MIRVECSSSPLDTDLIGCITFYSRRRAVQFAKHWTAGTGRFTRLFYYGPHIHYYGLPTGSVWFDCTIQNGKITYRGGIS